MLSEIRRRWFAKRAPSQGEGIVSFRRAASPDSDPVPNGRDVLALVLAACLLLIGIKFFIACRDLNRAAQPPEIYDGQHFYQSLGRIAACSAEDLAVGLICLLVSVSLLRVLKWPWARLTFLLLAHLAALLAVAYMVVNAQVYHVLRRFLNYPLVLYAGGLHVQESIFTQVRPTMLLALVMLPLSLVGLHFWLRWSLGRVAGRAIFWACHPLLVIPGIIGLLAISRHAQVHWFPEDNCDFARNPHGLLVRSCFWRLDFGDLRQEGPADVTDFEPGRPVTPAPVLTKPPTRIVLIVLESVGSVYLQACGSPLPTAPQLEALKDKSLNFENVYATGNLTAASSLCLFGSTYNDPRGHATLIDSPDFPMPSAAAWLKRHGYRTYFLGGGSSWGYAQLGRSCLQHFDVARDAIQHWTAEEKAWPVWGVSDYDAAAVFQDGLRCLNEAPGQKTFLMLWPNDTHFPYRGGSGPPEFDEAHFPSLLAAATEQSLLHSLATDSAWSEKFRRYLQSIWQADRLIGSFYRELETKGLADSTLVVITGDHGEAFGQHGTFSHGHGFYEEEVRVPLIFLSPALRQAGTRCATLSSHIDLWPTLASVCGFPVHPRWQGRNLFMEDPNDRRLYFTRFGSLGVREGNYKYIWDCMIGREFLFDVCADPAERINLAPGQRRLCARQRRRLMAWTNFQSGFLKREY